MHVVSSVEPCGILSCSLFGQSLTILCEHSNLFEHISRFLGNTLSKAAVTPSTVRFVVFAVPSGGVLICCPETGMVRQVGNEADSWVTFRRMLSGVLLHMGDEFDHFHGACAVSKNGAVLLLGETGSGKTSLLISLLRRGLSMACDDLIPISREDAKVRALPLGVTVNEDGFQRFPELEPCRKDRFRFWNEDHWQWTLNLSCAFPFEPVHSILQPRYVVFIEPAFHEVSQLIACSQEDAAWRLQMACKNRTSPRSYPGIERFHKSCLLDKRLLATSQFLVLKNGLLDQSAELIYDAIFSDGPF